LVHAHHKNLHWFSGGKGVLHALEEIVVPGQRDVILVILFRFGAVINFADLASAAGVAADDHQQPLALARFFAATVRLDAHVVAQRTAEENVVPRTRVQGRNLNIREVIFNGNPLPEVVIRRMGQPVEVIRRDHCRSAIHHTRRVGIENRVLRQR